jgi:hypothetical protein
MENNIIEIEGKEGFYIINPTKPICKIEVLSTFYKVTDYKNNIRIKEVKDNASTRKSF